MQRLKLLIRHKPDNDSYIDEHSVRRRAKYEVGGGRSHLRESLLRVMSRVFTIPILTRGIATILRGEDPRNRQEDFRFYSEMESFRTECPLCQKPVFKQLRGRSIDPGNDERVPNVYHLPILWKSGKK